MRKRLLRWFFFNLLFTLTPLTLVILFRWLGNKLTTQDMESNLSEILFFALMVCVTAMGDLIDVAKPIGRDTLLYAIQMFLIFGAVISAVLYGAFLFDSLIGTNIAVFRSRLMLLSIGVAIVLFLLGTATQVLLARIVPEGE